MAKDIKSSVRRLQRAKTDIVNAIETKGVSVPDGAKIDDMPELISHIETGIDTSDATATAGDIAYGKTAYVNGQKVAGEISTLVSAGTTPEFVNGDIRMPYSGDDRILIKKDSFLSASADKFGDAAAENVLKGKTFTSSAGLAVAGTLDPKGGGIDTSDATATASDIAQGKTAYVNGEKVNGTISTASNIVNADATVKQIRRTPVIGNSYYEIEMQATGTTAPGSGKHIFDGESVEISLDVNSSKFGNAAAENVLKGKTFTSSAGLAVAGTHVCKQPKLQTKSVTPSAAAQNVTPDSGYDGLSSVAVSGDANLTAANIKKGVSVFGIAGTHECPAPKLHEKQITPSAAAETYYPDEGYDGIYKISVVGDPDLSPENIVYGKQIFDVVGSHKCPTFTTQEKTVTPSANSQTVQPDSGYDGLSQVTVSGDTNLTPANIRKDISIFGVTGTMETPGGGIDTSDATATASDIAQGKTAYVNGEKVTGMISKTSNIANADATVKQIRKTPMVGSSYYDIEMQATGTTAPGSGKYIFDGESVKLSLDVNSSKFGNAAAENVLKGKTFTSSAGLSVTGTHVCKQPNLQIKSVTPSAAAQNVTPDSGYDGLSQVTVSGDTNLTPANIRKDISIFGVTGTMETPGGGTDTSDATATAEDIAKDKTAYVNGEKITGTAYDHLVTRDVSPTNLTVFGKKSIGLIATASGACHIASGTSVSLSMDADKWGTAAVTDVLKGKTFTSENGVKIAGTYEPPSTEPSLQAKSVTPSAAAQNVTPDSGYDGLSQVTVSGDTNLTAGNIKKGVSIFGVIGAYEEAASGGNGNNNCEAYLVDVTNPTVNFKTASGTIKVYGYAYETSSSSWGGSSTTVLAFDGDGYYKSASWGSPSKTSCTFGVSGGKLTGLPTLNGGTLLVVRGI